MRSALLLLPFAIPLAVEATLLREVGTAAGLVVSPGAVDLGQRSFGDSVRIRASVTNTSPHLIRLDPPRSDCGCLATSTSTPFLAPGQSVEVTSVVQAAPLGPLRRAIDLTGWGGADGTEKHIVRLLVSLEVVRGMILGPRVSHSSTFLDGVAVHELAFGCAGLGAEVGRPEVTLEGDLLGRVEWGRELAPELRQLTAVIQARDPSAFGLLSSTLRVEDPLGKVPAATARLLANRPYPGVTPWPACWLVVPRGGSTAELLEIPLPLEIEDVALEPGSPPGYRVTVATSAAGTQIGLLAPPVPRPEATVWIRARIAGGRGTIQAKVNDLGG